MKKHFHLWTPENQQVIFTCEDDFKTGMNIFALCAVLYPSIAILTFELMDNHIHIVLYCTEAEAKAFFARFKYTLKKWLNSIGRFVDLSEFVCKLRALDSTTDIMNVISYSNRNGFLANPDQTPYSYRWGAGRFFFNSDAKLRYNNESTPMTMTHRRQMLHSHAADKVGFLKMLDGYVCPLSYCRIEAAESYYRTGSNYFYQIARNIEAQKAIATEIGETIRYTDEEMFRIANTLCKEKFPNSSLSLISQEAKIDLATKLHYEWGATKKQLCRILKIPAATLDQLFVSPK